MWFFYVGFLFGFVWGGCSFCLFSLCAAKRVHISQGVLFVRFIVFVALFGCAVCVRRGFFEIEFWVSLSLLCGSMSLAMFGASIIFCWEFGYPEIYHAVRKRGLIRVQAVSLRPVYFVSILCVCSSLSMCSAVCCLFFGC